MSAENDKEKNVVLGTQQFLDKSESNHSLDLKAGDRDIAAEYAAQGRIEISPELEKRIRRKADFYVCTAMILVYSVEYADKFASNSASILGLREDLNMTGTMYNWVSSSFYLGCIVFVIPMVTVLQKLPLAKTIGVIVCLWGVVLAASGACQIYSTYIVTRVILGALEGAILPAFVSLTSQWYKLSEQYCRVLIWFGMGNGIGVILCNSIAYGLSIREDGMGESSFVAWRILFVVLGVVTIVIGVAFAFHMPDNPSKAWFLNEEERRGQIERIRANQQGYGNRKTKWYQVRETFTDVRTYLIAVIILLCQVPTGGIINFNAIIIQGMGYTSNETLLMGLPNGAVQFVGQPLEALLAIYIWRKRRMYWAIVGALGSVLSTGLLAFGPNNASRLAGLYVWCLMVPILYVSVVSLVVSNTAGHTKKSLTSGIVTIATSVGLIVGPQAFKPSEEPTYPTATANMVACYSVDTILLVVLYYVNRRANKIRDKANEKISDHIKNSEFADLTDRENPEFRYEL